MKDELLLYAFFALILGSGVCGEPWQRYQPLTFSGSAGHGSDKSGATHIHLGKTVAPGDVWRFFRSSRSLCQVRGQPMLPSRHSGEVGWKETEPPKRDKRRSFQNCRSQRSSRPYGASGPMVPFCLSRWTQKFCGQKTLQSNSGRDLQVLLGYPRRDRVRCS